MKSFIPQAADLQNVGRGHFGTGVPFSPWKSFWMEAWSRAISPCRTAFGLHIGHVISASSKKEVLRIYARRVVASVQDAKVFGVGAVVKFVHDTRGVEVGASVLKASDTVTIFARPSQPQKTPSVGFWTDTFPETLQLFIGKFWDGPVHELKIS